MGSLTPDKLVATSCEVFKQMLSSEDTLSKQRIAEILGSENAGYYGSIVDALSNIGKVTKIQGRSGGIRFRRTQGQQRKITERNKRALIEYFSSNDLEVPTVSESDTYQDFPKESAEEKNLYEPLRAFLDASGNYDIVEKIADNRRGIGKWSNPDLITVSYSVNLKYHIGLYPKVYAFEVKPAWPSIVDIQQAASYLRFCQQTYLCFVDDSYKGSDVNRILDKLHNEALWSWAELYNVGLVVAFRKQIRSTDFAFQIVKQPLSSYVEPEAVEQGLQTYLSEESRELLAKAMKDQLKTLL